MRHATSTILTGAMVLLSCVSCAKVGDPLPPLVKIPNPVDYDVVQQGRDRIEIRLPGLLEDIREVELYRECGTPLEDFQGSLLTRVRIEEIKTVPGEGTLIVQDPEPTFDEPCRYQVRVRNSQGKRSPPSLSKATVVLDPPGVPENLRVVIKEQCIIVTWDPPQDTPKPVAYLVNSVHTVPRAEFTDENFVFGEPVSYSVQSIGRTENPVVLSSASPVLTVVPRDDFAPSAPESLTAVSLGSRVQLLWDARHEPDLSGYFIYRGRKAGQLEKLSTLIEINRYIDEMPLSGAVSYYAVTAVDKYGNESVRSETVAVNINP